MHFLETCNMRRAALAKEAVLPLLQRCSGISSAYGGPFMQRYPSRPASNASDAVIEVCRFYLYALLYIQPFAALTIL